MNDSYKIIYQLNLKLNYPAKARLVIHLYLLGTRGKRG